MKSLNLEYCVYDEAHQLKNMATVKYKALMQIKVGVKLQILICLKSFYNWFDFVPKVETKTAADRHAYAEQSDGAHVAALLCDAQPVPEQGEANE